MRKPWALLQAMGRRIGRARRNLPVRDCRLLPPEPIHRRAERRRSNRMVLSDLWGSGVEHDADLIVSLFQREFYIWGRIGSLKHHEIPGR